MSNAASWVSRAGSDDLSPAHTTNTEARDQHGAAARPGRHRASPSPRERGATDAEVQSLLSVLSTYLGHVNPSNTYWYLSAAPELMQLAGERLQRHLDQLGDRT
jgi:hypothetical protein